MYAIRFIGSVIFLVAIGIVLAVAMAFGVMITWDDDLDANAWRLLYMIAGYFLFWFTVLHAWLAMLYRAGRKIDNLESQVAEYAYLILTITSLVFITEIVPNIAKLHFQNLEQSAGREFSMFRSQAKFGNEACARGESKPQKTDILRRACIWVGEASLMDERALSRPVWERLKKEKKTIEQMREEFLEQVANGNAASQSPFDVDTLIVHFDKGSFSILSMNMNIMENAVDSFLLIKDDEATLKDYNLPLIFLNFRLFAPFVLAYALALRLARATAEAAKMVQK